MRLDPLKLGVLALALALSQAEGQSPGAAIPQALRALTEGFGGCFGDIPSRSVELSYFADLRFVRGKCVLEHGQAATARPRSSDTRSTCSRTGR